VKGDSGAVGLTENPAALRRWMVSATTGERKKTDTRHYEQTKSAQKAFLEMSKC